MSGVIVFWDKNIELKFKPNSQLYPYARLSLIDEFFDDKESSIDFDKDDIPRMKSLAVALLECIELLENTGVK